jgi:hypothetical protein
MPVVNVGKVRMRVRERFMLMGMDMRFCAIPWEVVLMLVVGVVAMRMRVMQPLVAMLMLVPFRDMQPNPGGHQCRRNPEHHAGLFAEQQQ